MTGARHGFSLIEVALALGIASFCLLSVFSLLPLGLQTTRASVEQNAASSLLGMVAGDLRVTPPGTTPSNQFQLQIGTATTLYLAEDGSWTATLQPQSRYLLTITYPANSTGGRGATFASLTVSWPAGASLANASGSATSFLALDRN
ncbi:MAG: hypothetical protein ABI540_09415 [Spartobacteria bacterium]